MLGANPKNKREAHAQRAVEGNAKATDTTRCRRTTRAVRCGTRPESRRTKANETPPLPSYGDQSRRLSDDAERRLQDVELSGRTRERRFDQEGVRSKRVETSADSVVFFSSQFLEFSRYPGFTPPVPRRGSKIPEARKRI
ncbi:hypothetical protein GOBAR_AA08822 [Gossypium barbadense]|uniref:Uncharacterized protein n=1 Tax=Gossypium barbadense TaxID=3634 RepID=A0A2P5Y8A8_GOSBA|nr:hypothetical protein GOBAR_AA08822 [Gossypium barbadense]